MPSVVVACLTLVVGGCALVDPAATLSPTTVAATPSPTPIATPTAAPPTATPTPSPAAAVIHLDVVAKGFDQPLDIAAPSDGTGRLFVVEQVGRIRIVRDGVREDTPFLDITGRVRAGGERGLLGMALHPDYPTDGRVFVDYTDLDGNTVVSSFETSLDGDVIDPGSEKVLLQVQQPFANHNGGSVVFGTDGMLYIGLGDGGSGGDPNGNGQDLGTLLGKILRIDVDVAAGSDRPYAIPDDNPYADSAGGAKPEIWASGVRNPWRMRVDAATGDLWIGDVGQAAWEEVDVVRAGEGGLDLGWNVMEGTHCYQPADGCDQTGMTLPVAEYGHDQGCAIVGGVVVHDRTAPTIDGRYIFSDDCTGNVWLIDTGGDSMRVPTLVLGSGRAISAIGQDGTGAVFMTDLGSGELLRVVEAGS